MATVMLGRVVKHNSPSILTDQMAGGMSMSMGGGAGMGGMGGTMGGMMGGQGEAAAKLGKKLQDAAAAAMAANRPPAVRPSWRSY